MGGKKGHGGLWGGTEWEGMGGIFDQNTLYASI